jgi:alkaline phosphatase D
MPSVCLVRLRGTIIPSGVDEMIDGAEPHTSGSRSEAMNNPNDPTPAHRNPQAAAGQSRSRRILSSRGTVGHSGKDPLPAEPIPRLDRAMKLAALLFCLLPGSLHALGFANGVKIGEVTDTTVVLWARLTEPNTPLNPVAKWQADEPNWVVPGKQGTVHFLFKASEQDGVKSESTGMFEALADNDFCIQTTLTGLKPDTRYEFTAVGQADGETALAPGSFTTAPAAKTEAPVSFTVSTCQEFELRDDPDRGHKIYESMLAIEPDFFIQTGDTLYYDRKPPLSKNIELARYRWHRMYGLPFQKKFHARVPSYWMHDDHDLLKNDCWAGQTYGDLTWEQGLKVWGEQIPQSEKPYRTFRWGKNLQIWLPEGREFRSPNNMPDGPEKSILGKEQWKWLEETMKASDATFKLYVSATPVVGPDRGGKNDNHANAGFTHEGKRLREFLNSIPGCFVINGDRHWQYHSIDAETGLNEFGCGPASDAHAQGWNPKDKRPEHQFLRVKGGFARIQITSNHATFTHHTVDGDPVYTATIPAPPGS